jgi:hypothetical protein
VAASASRVVGSGVVAVLALGAVTGCDSTQNKNERAKLRATRELASRKPQRVTTPNPDVRVTNVALVRDRRSTAVVVDLRSSARTPLTDVPISVGVGRVSLNARRGLDWFQTHVPAIPPGGRVSWVFVSNGRLRLGGRPFARVGVPASPAISHAGSLPSISAAAGPRGRVVVENTSDVPQYGLQVYALAREGRRYVAAGKAALEHLGTGRRKTVRVVLTGPARNRPLRVYAIPAIFQ